MNQPENKPVQYPFKCVICRADILNEEEFHKHVQLHVAKIVADACVKLERQKEKDTKNKDEY